MSNYEQILIDKFGLTIPKPDTAEILKISEATLDRLRIAGKIRAKKIGGRVLFTPKEIITYLNLV